MWSGHILFVFNQELQLAPPGARQVPTVREGRAMSRPSIRYARPRAGDECFICPAAGVPGVGSWWALVVSTVDTLTEGTMYVRVVPLDQVGSVDAQVRTYFVRLPGLLVRRTV
jgi:hypothetical protein